MKFKYTALSTTNQKIEGVLTAENQALAQEELHKMGFSIIALNETQKEEGLPEAKREGVLTFFFRGTDKGGKTMEGTIEAETDENAYRRLVTDYHFKVEIFYPLSATEEQKKAIIQKKEEWDESLRKEEKNAKIFEGEEALDPALIKEIDSVIKKGKEVLNEHNSLFKAETLKIIQERLGDLQRIRASNNRRHIEEVSGSLLELIRAPDAAPLASPGQAFQKSINELENNAFFKENLTKYEKKLRLSGVRFTLNQIKEKLGFLGLSKKPAAALYKDQKLGFKKIVAVFYAYLKAPKAVIQNSRKRDFSGIFLEIGNFTGWLLSFYLLYFLLVSFSLEKRVGIPVEWVARTLSSSLLFDLASALFITHLLLIIKLKKFRQNFWGSFFLFAFGYGMMTLLLFNF